MIIHKKESGGKISIAVRILCCAIAGLGILTVFAPASSSEARTEALMKAPPGSFAHLAKNASQSVVNIYTVKVIKERGRARIPFAPSDPMRDFFERFFRDQMPKDYKQRSLGSGFVIDEKGYIVTNNHVVEKSDEIKVRLSDEREFSARIIGRDPKTDLALIKIDADGPLTPLLLGDSDKLDVGDWVVAIGNPFGLGNTVTAGIVSAKYRQIGAGTYDNFIQTDASINPGNSGGPLLNMAGEVIGINTAIFSSGGGSVGIGFAIPVNMAKDLLPQLKKGRVVRGWLGVMIQDISKELKEKLRLADEKGALVADVKGGGPADKAGIKRGDVIVSFDGKEIHESNDLPYLVASTPVGKTVRVMVLRKGRKTDIEVKIGELEEEEEAPEVEEPEAQLGLTVQEITPEIAGQFGLSEKSGLVVMGVESGSPAAEAGMSPGDIILEMDQEPLKDLSEFNKKIKEYKKGDTVLLLVERRGSTVYLTLKVSE
ncbi:MAG: DegQ family serine endoprotease [Pseudomonadota bacterium]